MDQIIYNTIGIIVSIIIYSKLDTRKLKQRKNTKFINDEKIITNKQIDNFIKLFDRDYRPKTIIIYNKRKDVFTHIFNVNIFVSLTHILSFNFWKGNTEGVFNRYLDTIVLFIYTEEYDNNDLEAIQLFSLHTLTHELRHRKQIINMQNKEKDADDFANNIINNKSDKISRIMNWSDEWEIEE